MKTYRGVRTETGPVVIVTDDDFLPERKYQLPTRLDVANHSPNGFEWGYGGSGPSQLALAILVDHYGIEHKQRALANHQEFKRATVENIQANEWSMSSIEIAGVLGKLYAHGRVTT